MGSDLVLSVCNTCAGQYKVLRVTSRYNITPKMLKKSVKVTDSDQKWPLWRVMGSDLVLSVCNTCAGQYTVLYVVITHNISPKTLKNP